MKRNLWISLSLLLLLLGCHFTKRPMVPEVPSGNVERESALRSIGNYGGFYELDDQGGVNTVNLVWGEDDDGARINVQNDFDEIIAELPSIPELRKLYIHEGQSTDRSMKFVAQLPKLGTLMMWDAEVTDAGVKELQSLPNLSVIHISNAGITDESLRVFGNMPGITSLSLQGNRFTDAGLEHLKGLKRLDTLWVDRGESKITDEGLQHLSSLKSLETLGIQSMPVSGEGLITHLKDLPRLRQIHLAYEIKDEKAKQRIADALKCRVDTVSGKGYEQKLERLPEDRKRDMLNTNLRIFESALQAYYYDHRRYPKSLGDLEKPIAYLTNSKVVDIFDSSKQLLYQAPNDGQTCVIYSRGPNGIDDGGDSNNDIVKRIEPTRAMKTALGIIDKSTGSVTKN
jgi:hypothetical protein